MILDSERPSLRNADDLSIINIAKQVRQNASTSVKFTTASAEIIDNEAVQELEAADVQILGHSFIRYRNLDTKRQFRWKNHASGTSNQQLEHHSSLNVSIEDIQSVFQTLLSCLASCDGS